MKLEELQEWCKENLLNKKGELNKNKICLNQKWIKTYHLDVYKEIIDKTNFLNEHYKDVSFQQRLFHILNKIHHIVKCDNCKENPTKFIKFNVGYNKYCCKKCRYIVISRSMRDTINNRTGEEKRLIKEKIKNTFIEKYSVDNPFKSKTVQAKIKETNLDKYGVENVLKMKDFRKDHIRSRTCSKTGQNKTDEEIEKIIDKRKNTGSKRNRDEIEKTKLKRRATGKNKTDEEIKNIIEKIERTKKNNGSFGPVSKFSQFFLGELYNNLKEDQKLRCYFHGLNYEFKIYNYSVDFLIDKKIIEIYGDRGHANPLKYKKHEIPEVFNNLTSEKIGFKDNKRKNIIIDEGYEMYIIGVSEIKKHKQESLEKCIKFINR